MSSDGYIPRIAKSPVNSPCAAAMFAHLARLILLGSEHKLTPIGLRPRHLVALTLVRERGSVPQQSLAGLLSIDGRNVVGLLNELEAEGLIARTRSETDRRRHTVQLTSTGSKRLRAAESAVARAEDQVLAALDSEQRAALYALLQQATADHTLDPNVGLDAVPEPSRPAPRATKPPARRRRGHSRIAT